MTGTVYDHLMAAIILGVLFVAAVVAVPNISYVNLLHVDQQQMRNIALSALKTILFDEGYPSNWGSMHGIELFNETDVARFGLARQGDPSFYVLDMDKVLRLAEGNPMGNISYAKMRELLGLENYGFSITIRPPFRVEKNVTVNTDQSGSTINYNVNVSRNDGQPTPNAIIHATIIYTTKKGNDYNTHVTVVENVYTDLLGRASDTVTLAAPQGGEIKDVIVLFKVTVAGRTTLVIPVEYTQEHDEIADINMVGDSIILTVPEKLKDDEAKKNKLNDESNARWVTSILSYNFDSLSPLLNGSRDNEYKLTYGKGYGVWNQTFPGLSTTEPSVLIFTFDTVEGGRTLALMVGPYALWGSSGIITYHDVSPSSGASVSVERNVVISGMAYIAELKLWKESI